jgi:hypothetical protein
LVASNEYHATYVAEGMPGCGQAAEIRHKPTTKKD